MKKLYDFMFFLKNLIISVKFLLFAIAAIAAFSVVPIIFPDDVSAAENNFKIASSRVLAWFKPSSEKYIFVSFDRKGKISSSGLHQNLRAARSEADQRCKVKSDDQVVGCVTKQAFLFKCYATIRRTNSGAGAKIILGIGSSEKRAIRDGLTICEKGNEVFESVASDGCEFTEKILCL